MKATTFLATAITAMHFNICKDNEWHDALTIVEAKDLVDNDDMISS